MGVFLVSVLEFFFRLKFGFEVVGGVVVDVEVKFVLMDVLEIWCKWLILVLFKLDIFEVMWFVFGLGVELLLGGVFWLIFRGVLLLVVVEDWEMVFV